MNATPSLQPLRALGVVPGGAGLAPCLLLSAALLLAALGPSVAHAHSGGNEDVMATLDTVPAGLGKIKVELHTTLAPQLVVENTTATPLEILGTDGLAFLRIGPAGVEANVNAPDWYRFYSTSGVPLPQRLSKLRKGARLSADWQLVSRTPAWGWFDTRLATESLKVPHRVRESSAPTAFQRWRIPVKLGGKTQLLSGKFEFVPQPAGFNEARLTSPSEIAPGVFLQVLQGPVPGFMIDNTSGEPLTILDRDGQPFLELTPAGVRANTRSAAWRGSGVAESSYAPIPHEAGDGPAWQVRSSTPRFTWLDARAAAAPPANRSASIKASAMPARQQWEIPFVYHDKKGSVRGVTQWVAFNVAKAPE